MRDRMEIGTGTGVLSRTRGTHPVYVSAARILCPHHLFGPMTIAETRDLNAANRAVWKVGHVHVEYNGLLQR